MKTHVAIPTETFNKVMNTIVTFTKSAPWIVPGRVYTAMIWMGDGSGARDNECSFIAMMEV